MASNEASFCRNISRDGNQEISAKIFLSKPNQCDNVQLIFSLPRNASYQKIKPTNGTFCIDRHHLHVIHHLQTLYQRVLVVLKKIPKRSSRSKDKENLVGTSLFHLPGGQKLTNTHEKTLRGRLTFHIRLKSLRLRFPETERGAFLTLSLPVLGSP